eukprot:7167858-Ditylum_brightwellii.AAC.1
MFPHYAKKVKKVSQYEVKDRRDVHMAITKSDFLDNTMFRSTKESIQCLGHLTNMNPLHDDCAAYQELINGMLAGIAKKKLEENKLFHALYNTTAELAKLTFKSGCQIR